MAKIHKLKQDTINKIAAGEVVERPMAVVKELAENAIDANATTIAVEIADGGKSLIRITDNGSGIENDDIEIAFLPHTTSKIQAIEDLLVISSLGFRGEALASIASVSQLEMITKTKEALMGRRYVIEGGKEKEKEDVGCPDGTTFLVRNLFYNTPARLKFLKTAQTEAGYISGLVERLALSHPDISFRFINQKQTKLSTSGNGNLKDVIYHIYGREITSNLVEVNTKEVFCTMTGYIGKPVISRGNRAMMNYFINGRYIKSPVIQKAIEEVYAPYTMQHRYPFTVLHLQIDPKYIDVNVHPQKMEIRFTNEKEIFQSVFHGLSEALKYREYIPEVTFTEKKETKPAKKEPVPVLPKIEPFEKKREARTEYANVDRREVFLDSVKETKKQMPKVLAEEKKEYGKPGAVVSQTQSEISSMHNTVPRQTTQETLFDKGILSHKAQKELKIIGQVFSTYWIMEYEDKMYLVDQHAAHEKVLYERFVKEMEQKEVFVQMVEPPVILTLSMSQQQAVMQNEELLGKLGYQIEPFGGREYAVTGVPAHLPEIGTNALLMELIDSLTEETGKNKPPKLLLEKLASMSCKAAVKGKNKLPVEQMEELLKELMELENPYHCPHGRPTMISMTKYELEKKFKRIV